MVPANIPLFTSRAQTDPGHDIRIGGKAFHALLALFAVPNLRFEVSDFARQRSRTSEIEPARQARPRRRSRDQAGDGRPYGTRYHILF